MSRRYQSPDGGHNVWGCVPTEVSWLYNSDLITCYQNAACDILVPSRSLWISPKGA